MGKKSTSARTHTTAKKITVGVGSDPFDPNNVHTRYAIETINDAFENSETVPRGLSSQQPLIRKRRIANDPRIEHIVPNAHFNYTSNTTNSDLANVMPQKVKPSKEAKLTKGLSVKKDIKKAIKGNIKSRNHVHIKSTKLPASEKYFERQERIWHPDEERPFNLYLKATDELTKATGRTPEQLVPNIVVKGRGRAGKKRAK